MILIRTDLAAEGHAINAEQGVDDGIIIADELVDGIKVTRAEVYRGEGEQKAGRKAGVYLTAEVGRLWVQSTEERNAAAMAVKSILQRLLPKERTAPVLVAGLGNDAITPDAIGPRTVGGLVVTHHMKLLNKQLYDALGFGDMAAICTGVLGQTGIESAALIKGAVEKLCPCCVIAVDALAARGVDRLGTTVQITDTGIAPGSGVQNGREELSADTLGCPVIGVGVPTVVDARTLVWELSNKKEGDATPQFDNFFVTPKETDIMVRVVAKALATAINGAIHENATDIDEYAPL